jgi:hypothetical protein
MEDHSAAALAASLTPPPVEGPKEAEDFEASLAGPDIRADDFARPKMMSI